MAKGRSWSDKERAEVIAAYRRSGLSARAFALREGIGVSTLHGWLKPDRQSSRAIPMARVQRTSQRSLERGRSGVCIERGQLRVVVDRGFDREVLASVLEMLAAGGESL